MAIYKNIASQKIAVYAHDTAADAPKTGDAANITAQISKDGGTTAATNDANPTELDATDAPGIYLFDMTQAETNADLIVLQADSSTADISIEPVIIYTLPTWTNTQVAQTGDSYTRLGAPAGASVSADIATVDGNVDSVLADTGTDGVVVAAASKNGYALSAAGIQAIWDALTSALTTASSIGKLLVDNINATISSRSSHSAADVWSAATRVLTANTNLNDPTAAAIADAVWDEAKSGHVGAGSFGEEVQAHALSSEVSGLSTLDAAGVRGAVGLASANLDTQLDALPTAAEIRAEMDSNSTQLAAILLDTAEIGLAGAGLTEAGGTGDQLTALATQASVNTIDTNVDAILVDTGTTIPAQIAALNNVSVAQILTTQMTESYAADGAAPTVAQALMMIQQMLGEFSISGTSLAVKTLNGSTTAAVYTLNDATNPTGVTRTS